MASRTHIQEYESELILQKFMIKENILVNFCKHIDFGIDGELDILQEEPREDFYEERRAVDIDLRKKAFVQLKSRRKKSRVNEDGTVSYRFKKRHLKLWKSSPIPVFVFLVYLDDSKEIYWTYVDIDLQIEEGESECQNLTLEKLERGCRNKFNKIIEEHYKKTGYKYIVSTKLPMFRDFIERRKKGLAIRKNLIFKELNPIEDRKAKMLSPFPKSGLRKKISFSEYALSIDDFYEQPDNDEYIEEYKKESRTEKDYIKRVYEAEQAKIIYDLVNGCNNFFDDSWIEIFEDIEKKTEGYTRPILFINGKLKTIIRGIPAADRPRLVNQVLQKSKEDEISNSHYKDKINVKQVYFYFFRIPKHLEEKFPVLNDIKIIILDREKVKYIVKEPLRLEWRTITKPVPVDIVDSKTYEIVKIEEEWDWFDFTCYTVGEIRNKGPIKIYKYSEDEKKELQNIQDGIKKATKSTVPPKK